MKVSNKGLSRKYQIVRDVTKNSELVSRSAGTFLLSGQRRILLNTHVTYAVDLGGDVSVPIEHEACCVSVGAHILKDQPVTNLSSLKLSFV